MLRSVAKAKNSKVKEVVEPKKEEEEVKKEVKVEKKEESKQSFFKKES